MFVHYFNGRKYRDWKKKKIVIKSKTSLFKIIAVLVAYSVVGLFTGQY